MNRLFLTSTGKLLGVNQDHKLTAQIMEPSAVRLFVADVDGTLLDMHKRVGTATRTAIQELQQAGIQFSLVTSRPPRGLKWLIELLDVQSPCAALNGGTIIDRQLWVLSKHDLRGELVRQIVRTIEIYEMDVWIYTEADWYVRQDNVPHVKHEREAVGFAPRLFETLDDIRDPIIKIAGVSDHHDLVSAGAVRLRSHFGDQLSISRSLANHLDVTHGEANKGRAVTAIARALGIPLGQVATAGDGENDIPMFRASGLSMAMGQASAEVHRAASHTTTSNAQDGLARAIEEIILKRR